MGIPLIINTIYNIYLSIVDIYIYTYGCFQKYGYPKMDGLQWKTLNLGVPLFSETSIYIYIYVYIGYIPFSMGSDTGKVNQLGIHRGT